ncbi:MAG: hypothetical protein DRP70_16630 [Spirochaetes bacterium]|nr:MAG: hypothetical protein DRP60_01975 [Spirochaetota bacterium]RKX82272.1 MAG: hypothetical protein DRP70_16630 [Spirochaetota bacterium]RKX97579.1 MAG: hypothetical protein DRZ90_05810 [Spirochaetota bacterium]
MDYQGHQIFIVHPNPDICKRLVRSLRRSEYETYGFSSLDTDITVMQGDTVIFLLVSDDEAWDWRGFVSRARELKISMRISALGTSELPEGFDSFIESSDDKGLEAIQKYLDSIKAQGYRHFVRFGSHFASIATFNFHLGDRLYAGVIHDLSSKGMSCTFKPEPESFKPVTVENLNLNIHGYRAVLNGSFSSSRVVAGQVIHVFNFRENTPDDTMDHIYDFIYSSLETKLSLH